MRRFLMLCITVSALSMTGLAQAQTATTAATPDADLTKRTELAKEMHKIRPARAQVQEAVDMVARNLPPLERDRFMRMVEKAFDYNALEKLSTDTMVNLFTADELEKMVAYYGSPEAQSIEKKLPAYQEKIQPFIIKSLDSAMIADRTGNAPVPAAETPAKTTP